MSQYRIQGNGSVESSIEVLEHTSEGYRIKMIRQGQYERNESIEMMSRELFETCLRTGYFTPVESHSEGLASGIA